MKLCVNCFVARVVPKKRMCSKRTAIVFRWVNFLGFVTAITGAFGLKDVTAVIPQAASVGDTITLQCRYDLEGEPLYTLKWYKGSREFFRYIPKEHPSTQVFPYQDLDVDLAKSNQNSIVLRNLLPEHTGTYKCEVSSDAPNFYTKWVSNYLYVVHVPHHKPELRVERETLQIGYTLRANCTAPLSYPPMNVTWFLNKRLINASFITHLAAAPITTASVTSTTTTTTTSTSSSLSNSLDNAIALANQQQPAQSTIFGNNAHQRRKPLVTVAGLKVEVDPDLFHGGRATVRCQAKLFHLYHVDVDATLLEERPHPRPSSVLGNRDGSSGSRAALGGLLLINLSALVALAMPQITLAPMSPR